MTSEDVEMEDIPVWNECVVEYLDDIFKNDVPVERRDVLAVTAMLISEQISFLNDYYKHINNEPLPVQARKHSFMINKMLEFAKGKTTITKDNLIETIMCILVYNKESIDLFN